MINYDVYQQLNEAVSAKDKQALIKIINSIEDDEIFDKIMFVVADKSIDDKLTELNNVKNGSFAKGDLATIKAALGRAKGSAVDKANFLQACIEGKVIDGGRLLKAATAGVVMMDTLVNPEHAFMFSQLHGELGGSNKSVKFSLGSGAATGPGEGWMVMVVGGFTKGQVGDLQYGGKDVEVKASAARWSSARIKNYGACNLIYTNTAKILGIKGKALDAFMSSVSFQKTTFVSSATLKTLKIDDKAFREAVADSVGKIFPKSDISYFKKNKWVGDANTFWACYLAAAGSSYQKADGWGALLHYNYERRKLFAVKSAADVFKAVTAGKMKCTALDFKGSGTDGRSIAPQVDI